MKKLYAFLSLLSFVALTEQAGAVLYEGSILESSGLYYNDGWRNFELSWEVEKLDNSTDWVYRYFFSVVTPNASYAILEVSENTTRSDFSFSNISPTQESPTVFTYQNDSSTPFWPKDSDQEPIPIFGLKYETIVDEDGLYSFISITTNRAPMWGDFYAKGGTTETPQAKLGVAYNTGFGFDTDAPIGNGNAFDATTGYAWVLVPDTKTTMVPEPATMLLLGFGLMGMAFIGRRKFRK